MDLVIPRSKDQWNFLIDTYGTYLFTCVPGIYKPDSGGNYESIALNSQSVSDWVALDCDSWWLRDDSYSEPNGDYTGICTTQNFNAMLINFVRWRLAVYKKPQRCR